MRFLRRSLTGLVLVSLTLGLLTWAGAMIAGAVQDAMNDAPQQRPARERSFSVNVLPVTFQTVTPTLSTFGEVQSRRTLELRAAASGPLIDLAPEFVEGGRVSAGQLLARVDPVQAQAALDRAQSDLLDAEAEGREAARGLTLAQDELASAREQVALRDRAFRRQNDLNQRGVGTAAAVETAELAAAQARQSELNSRAALAQAEARVDQAATRLARAQIALSEAQRALQDTEIRAEFAGVLSDVTVVAGRLVSANERLAQIVDPTALEVDFRVSTQQYARLLDDAGQLRQAPVTVSLDIFGTDIRATGRLTREGVAVGEGQTGRLLFAELGAAPGFKPGDFVTVTIQESPLDAVARLPASALGADGQVLVVGEGDRLDSVAVTLLRRQGDDVLIRPRDSARGLQGREVVAERTPLLGAGIKVSPLRADGRTPEAPEMVTLTPERRAKLRAFVEANTRMPAEARTRILTQLEGDQVPAQMVERIESRMGG